MYIPECPIARVEGTAYMGLAPLFTGTEGPGFIQKIKTVLVFFTVCITNCTKL